MAKKANPAPDFAQSPNIAGNTAPVPKPARKSRTAKVIGPTNRAVMDVTGEVVALVLNCTTETSAVEAVTGKFTTRIVDISEGITMARAPGLQVIDLAEPAPTTIE